MYIYIYIYYSICTSSWPCCWYLSSGCLVSGRICTQRTYSLTSNTAPLPKQLWAKSSFVLGPWVFLKFKTSSHNMKPYETLKSDSILTGHVPWITKLWISWLPGFSAPRCHLPTTCGAGHLASPLLLKEVLKPSAAKTADVVHHYPKRSEVWGLSN